MFGDETPVLLLLPLKFDASSPMAHNRMTVFILENLLLFISHLLQKHTDRRRWLQRVCGVLLLLPICLSAELKFPSNFHKSTQSITAHMESYGISERTHKTEVSSNSSIGAV